MPGINNDMWLILGGSGFLGSEFRRLFEKHGILYSAPTSGQCDIRDPDALHRCVNEISPRVVINCAAMTNVDACEGDPVLARKINTDGPKALTKLCREKDVFFVHFSTDYVFSGEKRLPYVESDLTDPINVYGWTKRLSEEVVQALYPESLVIRTAWLFSERTKGFLNYLADALENGLETLTVSNQVGSPTYLKDLAETTLSLIEKRQSGLFHVVNGGGASWKALAKDFLSQFPHKGSLNIQERENDMRPAKRPSYSVLGTDKLREEEGIVIRPWQAAVKDCIKEMIKSREELK
jgi:dTDP-4-dehydrorhamnose reductase